MELTQGTEYAIRSAVFLARLKPGESSFVREISRRLKVPETFLAKLLTVLARAGVLESHRGLGGGYRLAARPERIRLREIIEAVEGPLAITRCLRPTPACKRAKRCSLKKVFRAAQDSVNEVLDSVTLADMAKDKNLHA